MVAPDRGPASAGIAADVASLPVAILVGGLGTRLHAVTGDRLPKPLVEVAGRPFLEYLLDQVAEGGSREVMLLTSHGGEAIRDRIGDGRRWGLRIGYSHEPSPLGTGGAIRNAWDQVRSPRLLVLNGDSFVGLSFAGLLTAHAAGHDSHGVLATIALVRVDDAARFGSVVLGPAADIVSFREKGAADGPGLVSAGIYVLERALIEAIPADRAVSLEREVWPRYCDGRLMGVEVAGPFADIGTPESLAALRADPAPLLDAVGGSSRG